MEGCFSMQYMVLEQGASKSSISTPKVDFSNPKVVHINPNVVHSNTKVVHSNTQSGPYQAI
uniref:Uncharacterized protein n=1 Tax=Arion vulgaris TaxID=1028688 RepID=A0A0B7ADJ6_9EUPU